jgi:hypothetical protein
MTAKLGLGYQPLPYRDPGQLVEVWRKDEPSDMFLVGLQ